LTVNRATVIDENLSAAIAGLPETELRQDLDAPVRAGAMLSARTALDLFESMLASRHLDLASRWLKSRGQCFYTIAGSGHEGNAAVAAALRPTDPAYLHYRSGGFFIHRARQVPGETPLLDVLLGCCASSDEPIAGGRHKVFGSRSLWIPPQTSTIASHLPKAMGAALAIDRMRRQGLPLPVPDDSIVVCSFGDASANHSTATGAINAACLGSYQNVPVPVLWVCEDNGIGLSVRTPRDWVRANYNARAGMRYFEADGLDLPEAWAVAREAAAYVRKARKPAFLRLRVVRLLGHAGSDVEQLYHSKTEIEASEARDPVLAAARMLVSEGWLSPNQCLYLYEDMRERVRAIAEEAATRPHLDSAEQVMAPLAPLDEATVQRQAEQPADPSVRDAFWRGHLPEDDERPRHLAVQLNRALGDLLAKYPEMWLFGEDVAKKGGVYHVTAELSERAGVGRVFNTLLDEQSILGMAIGFGNLGGLPMPEIQYLAYLHTAEDQLRGEAATQSFFSQGQFLNPMVVRIASYGYQKGFGGHFHNENSVAVLRDIPGLIIASPARPDDAVGMLRTCAAAAWTHGSVVAFLEPIALYMTRDLLDGDGEWCWRYCAEGAVPIGRGRVYGEGTDLLIVSWANGLWMSLRAARRMEAEGVLCRVLDLRWLAPLPVEDLLREAEQCGRVLIVDETRRTGGVSEALTTALVEGGFEGPMMRVTSLDCFVPLGDAANLVLVQEEDILQAARHMTEVP